MSSNGGSQKTPAEVFYERSDRHARNSFAQDYEKLRADAMASVRLPGHRYYCVFDFLQKNPGLEVAELGFGYEFLLSLLAEKSKTYTIIDVVDRRTGSQLPENIVFQKADLNYDFPIPDASVDVSVAMMVVEHLFDPFHSFRELARITRPGGKVFINLPNIASIRCRLQLLTGNMPVTSAVDWWEKREWDGNHLHSFTVHDTLRLAELSGLRCHGIFPVGKSQWLKSMRPSLFCHEISYGFTRA